MRIVVIWILILSSSVVLSTKPSLTKVPKNFPSQFTASFNETDLINPSFLSNKVNTLYFDGQNQRAREVAPTAQNWIEDYYLFYKAPGAEPGSTAAKSYTKFIFNPYYPKNAPNDCYYKTAAYDNTALLFEQIWWTVAPTSSNEPYFFMFEYPDDMAYYGVQYIPELNVYADRWDSKTTCYLVSSNIGVVPCTSVFQSRDENQVTLKQIRAHAATGPFDIDRYLIRVFYNYQPSVSDSDFELPQNWPAYCGYGDAGFIFPTYKNVWADATNNNFTISLTARPVQALGGKVKVSFLPIVTEYYNCPTCVVLNPQTLFFDMTNWNIPQYVMVNYSKTGCEQLEIKASGGGYDWQYNEDINLIAMEACHYDPASQYCKEGFHICGGSR